MEISGLYLAAGQSVRMGTRKQSLQLSTGRPLASLALRALLSSPLAEIAIVVHPDDPAEWLSSRMEEDADHQRENIPPVHLVVSEESSRGMSFSIRSGMQALLASRPKLDAVVIALADQPFVTAEMVSGLTDYWRKHTHLDFVASSLITQAGGEAVLMPPALLTRSMFGDLLQLDGDSGARGLFRLPRYRGVGLPVPKPCSLVDIDTPADFELAKKLYLGGITKNQSN